MTVTPDAPAVAYDCVTDQLKITGADDTDSVDYTITVNQAPDDEASTWDVTITASPQPGYEFTPDAVTKWHFTGTVDCLTAVTPGAPSVAYDCVTDRLKITGADDTDSVDYTVTVNQAPDGEASTWDVTITATPQPGYEFAPDAVTKWNFTGTVDCLGTVTPGTPRQLRLRDRSARDHRHRRHRLGRLHRQGQPHPTAKTARGTSRSPHPHNPATSSPPTPSPSGRSPAPSTASPRSTRPPRPSPTTA